MEKRIPITTRGAQQLRAELDELKKVRRPEVVRAIAEARDKGDLSENAEYDAAKDLQGQIEGRIVFGATVELEDEDSGQAKTYQIVGDDEADIREGRISISSPLARALIGKYEGDETQCPAPKGVMHYAIVSVRYE